MTADSVVRKKSNLVWIDLEMTGLSPQNDRIIEIASIVTDIHLNIVAEGPELVIHQSDERLNAMDEWNTKTHGESGLIDLVRASTIDEQEAERQTLSFLRRYATKNRSPLCGNAICQDRRFLDRYMPQVSAYLHYRHLDVSTIKELAKRWRPELLLTQTKRNRHRAKDDIMESIEELRRYRDQFFLTNPIEIC
ncbi:MAG: oligoribonuclease [Acidiferrobacterales bacterium]|nr:oligoribonuclease [Acidiferrobacterales bacterium]